MQLWFHEVNEQGGFGLQFRIRQTLCQTTSPYQQIAIIETERLGRMMVLDGCVMLTERDEFFYHEMLAHPALCTHPNPERVLVIGGGDGGTVREALRYPEVEHIDLVELDEMVVRLSQEYLPEISGKLTDPRVSMYFEDGVAFMARHAASYDVIMIDSTDPVGPAAGLITESFFQNCKQALRPGGIIVMQSGSPFLSGKELKVVHNNLLPIFGKPQLYLSPMTSYPSGWWSFTMASEKYNALTHFQKERAERVMPALQYYNPSIHQAAFALPNFVQRLLDTDES